DHILYSRIKAIFKTGKIEDLPARLALFRSISHVFSNHKTILQWFWETLPNAILCLSYKENIPRTTNLLENLNGQIKQRIKTMRGVKSEKSLHNLLKILFYFRNYK
ncbi:transposase, partial [Candidatus Peregrinibacteria bacterium]|nr:transposase [Candidatus Peregrinibacteria bacterium]